MLEQQTSIADLPYAQAEKRRPSRRLRRFQVASLSLLVMSGMINMLDRSTLSIANPLIRHDLGLSVAQMGLLLSSFLWAYAFCQLPVGFLVDRIGPRFLLGAAQIVWSAAQLFCGFSRGFRHVLRHAHAARRRGVTAISDQRARGPGLFQSARPRPAHRRVPAFLLDRAGDCRAADHPAHDRFRLAPHVRPHGARRHRRRRHLALFLSFAATTWFRDERCALSRAGRTASRSRPRPPIGASCLATAPVGG